MEVDCISKGQRAKGKGQRAKGKGQRAKGKGSSKSEGKGRGRDRGRGRGKDSKGWGKGKGKRTKPDNQDKECYVCGKKRHFARDCWSPANQDRTVNEVDGKRNQTRQRSLCLCKMPSVGLVM